MTDYSMEMQESPKRRTKETVDGSFNPSEMAEETTSSILWNKVVLSILITETAERVAYFGFRAVLVLYFTHGLQFEESVSVSLCAGTLALAYFSPLVGAILADSGWGRYQTIWIFGVMYAIGLSLLTASSYNVSNYSDEATVEGTDDHQAEDVPQEATTTPNLLLERFLTLLGLLLVCMGTGGIKPCVSAFGADQVVLNDNGMETKSRKGSDDDFMVENPPVDGADMSTDNEVRIREFFNSFYFCINVGALGAFAAIPVVRARYGFGAAFLIPTVFMAVALLVFWSQRKEYKHRVRDESQPSLYRVFQAAFVILKNRLVRSRLGTCLRAIMGSPTGSQQVAQYQGVPEENPDVRYLEESDGDGQLYTDAAQALHILPILLFFPVFWMLYDQQGSVWTLQATRLNLHGLEPEQLQVLNPLEIMIFIPLFDYKIYPWLERHGFNIQPLRRIQYGMFLCAVAFFVSGYLQRQIEASPPKSISFAWQVPQITILTIAEILLSVTGLEFAYREAPSNMQALILALYLLTTSVGDGLAGVLYGSVFAHMDVAVAMCVCALCMLVNLALFARMVRHWKPYHQHATESRGQGLELGPVNHIEHQH